MFNRKKENVIIYNLNNMNFLFRKITSMVQGICIAENIYDLNYISDLKIHNMNVHSQKTKVNQSGWPLTWECGSFFYKWLKG